MIASWQESYDKPRQCVKKQKHHFANKGPYSQSYGLSNTHKMWELDNKEGGVPKNVCFQTVVLWKTLESPLESKQSKPVNLKGIKPWILFGRTDTEAEAPILWPPDVNRQLIGKDPDAGKDWRQKEKWATEDDIVGWHHWFNGYELGQVPGDGEGEGSLAHCSPSSCRVRHDWATKQQQNSHFSKEDKQMVKWKQKLLSPVGIFMTPWSVAH